MEQKKTPGINSTIVNQLNSSSPETVIKALKQLKETGNTSYIPTLIEVLHTASDQEIRNQIVRLLSDLKQTDAVPFLIEAIENKKYVNELRFLTSACWENGLDYSNHLSLFIDLVIEQELETAIEAYTVITNMSGKISQEIADKESRKLKEAMLESDEQKKALMHDLLDFLPAFERGISPQSY
ncbi:HEAT repeat domain-containing protein [Sunxiuqinia elliptica]|uniref:HEAT repeat protein n=1 Tax=Sunxiuqinia elliptica TaxID=655355 RepID=A0A4R6GUL5_9BACT|nr:HEAT repeat domain-containing protein [Sunxiuqinia elliptica]TDN99149.1 HEAT repeat protein [Sunxiuqinia elliptica]TDO56589.1 HEAT repeat protein [Sunxiuqinia elliptica]